jgi:gamma-carbonic anhydrase
MPLILPYNGIYPSIAPSAFIADNVVIIGDVEIGLESSIWYGCVIRGDVNSIKIGNRTNIQDNSVIHVNRNQGPVVIGNGVTIGHSVLIHASRCQDFSFIGMGSKVLDYSVIETNSMVGAGALIAQNKIVKSGEIWMGVPGKFFRLLNNEEIKYIGISEENYVKLAKEYILENKENAKNTKIR